jgi:polyisoprenoid-binding protein YceI
MSHVNTRSPIPMPALRWTRCAVAGVAVLSWGAPGATAQTEPFLVDSAESRVRVHLGRAGLLRFLGHDHTIGAPVSEGRIDVDPGQPARSRVDLKWKAAALAVVPGTEPAEDIPEVEERMRGPEVLHVEQYPGIRFWSFDIRVLDSEPEARRWRLHVKGGLEIKGARHTVELPLEVRLEGEEIVATGEVELKLERLGIEPPSVAGVVKVANDFRVRFEVRALRRSTVAPAPAPDESNRESSRSRPRAPATASGSRR